MKILTVGSADMNSLSFSACFLINDTVMIDIPGGACRHLLNYSIRSENLEAVLITHLHGDHTLDLPIWALKKSKMLPPSEDGEIRICAALGHMQTLKNLVFSSFPTSFTKDKTASMLQLRSENEFVLKGLHFRRIPVKHGILPDCFGYLVTDKKSTVGFTGDSCLCEGVYRIFSASDTVYCDCDLIVGNEKHMGINDLIVLRRKFPDTGIVAVHMRDETRKELSQMHLEGIRAAADGDILELKDYLRNE